MTNTAKYWRGSMRTKRGPYLVHPPRPSMSTREAIESWFHREIKARRAAGVLVDAVELSEEATKMLKLREKYQKKKGRRNNGEKA